MMGNYLTICPKVSLADVFFVVRPNENMSAYNRINRKNVDFLICDPQTLKPKFAIELDDASHQRADREERDEIVNQVFEAADLPLIHIPFRNAYNSVELGTLFKMVLQNISGNDSGERTNGEMNESDKASPDQSQPDTYAPTCPKCGVQMVLRTAKNGDMAGHPFYGCPNYPRCRQIITVEQH
ncbi:MAG: DUF2726 domain-containing protein [Bellilinea sp.]